MSREDRRRGEDRTEDLLIELSSQSAASNARQEKLMEEMVLNTAVINALSREMNWIKGVGAGLSFIWTLVIGWFSIKGNH